MDDLESKLRRWDNPLTSSEDQKCLNAKSMVYDAMKSNLKFTNVNDYEVFLQGSYENNTNVRGNSDLDVCVMFKKTFFTKYPEGTNDSTFGNISSSYSFLEFKKEILEALLNKFGKENIETGNKSFKINENTYRIRVDVVPSFEYKVYNLSGYNYSGVKFIDSYGNSTINYPKQHFEQGNIKNQRTNHFYKKMVRCFKWIMYELQDKGSCSNIKSFVVESILYNLSNEVFTVNSGIKVNDNGTQGPYVDMFKKCLDDCLNLLKNDNQSMKEANGIQFLFKNSQRNFNDYINFFNQVKEYVFR